MVFAGCWFFLPVISLIPMGMNWWMLLARESAPWDRERGLVAVQRPDGRFQQLLTFVAFLSLAGLYSSLPVWLVGTG